LVFAAITMLTAGAWRYSTLIEHIMLEPLVSEWQGPGLFRVGRSPTCGDIPCWMSASATPDEWAQLSFPHASLSRQLRGGAPSDHAYYRFPVTIPASLRDSGMVVGFSPNWVVHKRYDVYIDGAWVGAGNGTTPSGDIIYQKVVVTLPAAAVARGHAVVAIDAAIGPADLGIEHLGRILIGPATALNRLHVEAEYSMGSFYLLFLAAEGGILILFSLIHVLTKAREGFGFFVAYAFLMTTINLAIGNFLEGLIPFPVRVWLYFLAKALAAWALGNLFASILRVRRHKGLWQAALASPVAIMGICLAAYAAGVTGVSIATLHAVANGCQHLVVTAFLALQLATPARTRRPGLLFASLSYWSFLAWNYFVHATNDFDYRPLADFGLFMYMAWTTIADFGLVQAEAQVLRANFARVGGFLRRLLGRQVAHHLILSGSPEDRSARRVTILTTRLRSPDRLVALYGANAVLEAMDQLLGRLSDVVERHEGTTIELSGTRLVAVWGMLDGAAAPGAAVAAALEMRAAIAARNDLAAGADRFRLSFAGAVTTGDAIVGRLGRGGRIGFGVFGEAVNRNQDLLERADAACVDFVVDGGVEAEVELVTEELAVDLDAGAGSGDEALVLIGSIDEGRLVCHEPTWQEQFGDLQGRARVYGAAPNVRNFVPSRPLRRSA
jgi:class 3 adenylate cyclase